MTIFSNFENQSNLGLKTKNVKVFIMAADDICDIPIDMNKFTGTKYESRLKL